MEPTYFSADGRLDRNIYPNSQKCTRCGDLAYILIRDADEKPYFRLSRTSYIFGMPVRCARLYICGMVRYQLYYLYFLVRPFPGFQDLYLKVIQIFFPSNLNVNMFFFEGILVGLTVHQGLKYRINDLPPTYVYISTLFPRPLQTIFCLALKFSSETRWSILSRWTVCAKPSKHNLELTVPSASDSDIQHLL